MGVKAEKLPPKPLNSTFIIVGSGIVLALITFFAFRGGFQDSYVDWDDNTYVKFNKVIQNPSWGHLGKIFSTSLALNYHPLTVMTMMMNALFFGKDNASSFVVTNLILHIFNVLLTYWFVSKLSSGNRIVSFFTALLFAIHPLRVESVTWISERKDVLYAFFFLLACLSYLQYLDQNKRKYLILTLFLFLLSCLSKAQAVVFPLVMVLLDWWQHRKWLSPAALLEKIPFFAIAGLFGLIALNIQAGDDFWGLIKPLDGASKAIDLEEFSLSERIITGTFGFTMYLQKLFLPLNLSPLYPYERDELGNTLPYYFSGLVVFPLVLGGAWLLIKRVRYVFFGVAFFFITVLLVLQFLAVGTAIMADRYSYLPYLGVFFTLTMTIHQLTQTSKILSVVAWAVVTGFASWCFFLTTEQVKAWKDTGTLYSQRLKVYPNDIRALSVRGSYYGENGRIDDAIPDLEKAIQMGVKYSNTFDNLGTAYGMKGQYAKALEMFNRAIEVDSNNVNARFNRGVNLMNSNPLQATKDFEIVLKYSTDKAKNMSVKESLSICYSRTNRNDLALKTLNDLIDNDGNQNPQNILNRGILKQNANNMKDAIADYQKVLQLQPNNERAKQLLKALGGSQ